MSISTTKKDMTFSSNMKGGGAPGGSIIILLLLPYSYIAVEGTQYQMSGFLSKLGIKGTKSHFKG